MFGRLIDVVISKYDGTSLILVDHRNHPNTFNCVASFKRSTNEAASLTLTIYNLPAAVRGDIALNKYRLITVKFGYKDEYDNMGDLFIGNIQRTIYKREDAADSEMIIYALDTGEFKATSFFSATYANGINYYAIAEEIGKQAKEEGNADGIILSEKLKDYAVYGSKSMFGSSDEMLKDIADETGFVYKKSDNSLYLLDPSEIVNQTDIINFSVFDVQTGKVESRSGLIGFPKLTDNGLEFQCLVNTKLRIYSLAHINNSIISISQEGVVPEAQYGAILDPDGLYIVTSISGSVTNTGENNSMNVTAISRSVFLNQYSGE